MSDSAAVVTSPKQIKELLRELLTDLDLRTIVAEGVREGMASKWMNRDSVKEMYDVTNRQLQYMRDNNRVTYTQRGRRIWYLRDSIEAYFETGRVNADPVPEAHRSGPAA